MRLYSSLVLVLVMAAPALADEVPDRVDPVLAFERAMGSKDPHARRAAIEQVATITSRGHGGRTVASALGRVLASDSSPLVRKAAAKALGVHASPQAPVVLGEALVSDAEPDLDVVLEMVDALGRSESDAAALALVQVLRTRPQVLRYGRARLSNDDTLRVTAAALDALARIGSARSVEGILAFAKIQMPTYGAVHKKENLMAADPMLKKVDAALAAITGEHRTGPRSWFDWWASAAREEKLIQVFQCEGGRTYERPTPKAPCPDHGATCGWLLKTRFERGGLPPVAKPEKPAKKKKKK